jgi:DNA repair exonuclease SbcCD ATPase subunit
MQDDHGNKPAQNTLERYADELSGPDDYWLTITDAARATRRQEISIRRWISKGLLPVRKQHVGLNQRTRLVRASDLAALTPIIDPAGAISTERGRLDLISIPVQQAQIKEAQQRLQAEMDSLRQGIDADIQTARETLAEQESRQKQLTLDLTTELDRQFSRLYEIFERDRSEVRALMAQQEGAFRDAIGNTETRLLSEQIVLSQKIADFAVVVTSQEEKLLALSEARQHDRELAREQLEAVTTQLQQEIEEREQLTGHIERLETIITSQREQIAHNSQIQEQLSQQLEQLTANIHELQEQSNEETVSRLTLKDQQEQLDKKVEQLERDRHHLAEVQYQQSASLAAIEKGLKKVEQADQRSTRLEQTVSEIAQSIRIIIDHAEVNT